MSETTDLASEFVATCAPMLSVLAGIAAYARARTALVIVGASGTGKTTVAEMVHTFCGRAGALITQSVGEFEPGLERSQLFGHERGAFTGAVTSHVGLIEQTADGTLLLDDFHHIGPSTQVMLLRVLDRGSFRRVGGTQDLPVRCRVVIGLTRTPDSLVDEGTLLPELRFRLGYSVIQLPSLQDRVEDIPCLALQFLDRCPRETGQSGPCRLAPDVISVLQAADWPGNLRQLQMTIRDAYLRAHRSDVIRLEHLSDMISLPLRFRRGGNADTNAAAVRSALEAAQGRVRDAAKLLRTSRSTVYNYLAASRPRPELDPLPLRIEQK
jgi:two-component system, NtrC family, response regulator AtoC